MRNISNLRVSFHRDQRSNWILRVWVQAYPLVRICVYLQIFVVHYFASIFWTILLFCNVEFKPVNSGCSYPRHLIFNFILLLTISCDNICSTMNVLSSSKIALCIASSVWPAWVWCHKTCMEVSDLALGYSTYKLFLKVVCWLQLYDMVHVDGQPIYLGLCHFRVWWQYIDQYLKVFLCLPNFYVEIISFLLIFFGKSHHVIFYLDMCPHFLSWYVPSRRFSWSLITLKRLVVYIHRHGFQLSWQVAQRFRENV